MSAADHDRIEALKDELLSLLEYITIKEQSALDALISIDASQVAPISIAQVKEQLRMTSMGKNFQEFESELNRIAQRGIAAGLSPDVVDSELLESRKRIASVKERIRAWKAA